MNRSSLSIEEAKEFLAANPTVQWIDAFVLDMNGHPRGKRLRREALSVKFARFDIADISALPLTRLAGVLAPYAEGQAGEDVDHPGGQFGRVVLQFDHRGWVESRRVIERRPLGVFLRRHCPELLGCFRIANYVPQEPYSLVLHRANLIDCSGLLWHVPIVRLLGTRRNYA